jgi:hypothetical protein
MTDILFFIGKVFYNVGAFISQKGLNLMQYANRLRDL